MLFPAGTLLALLVVGVAAYLFRLISRTRWRTFYGKLAHQMVRCG